jgi:hypothetical protein
MPDQQADVAIGSPLAIVALVTEIVRERFREGNGLAWRWEDNPTPEPTETNDLDAPRKIVIEPAFNTGDEARNYRPAIFVDKTSTSPNKVVINNMAGKHLPSGLTGFFTLAEIPIEIECVSGVKAESATLADIVWFYILAGTEQIRKTFGIHDMSAPVLGSTGPFQQDKEVWSTKVTFTMQVEFRWTTKPVGPLLKSILLRLKDSGETNPDAYLLQRYIR